MKNGSHQEITVTSVLNKKKHRDSWFLDDYTLNPYSGCSFNCLFCYIRGSKYGIHMERKLAMKVNALEVLEKQLARETRKKAFGYIVVSSATDPYLQAEADTQLTRSILKLILKYRFPVHVITRSDLVVRDFDLLQEINREAILPPEFVDPIGQGALVTFSFSTIDAQIAQIFEPGATPPGARLLAMLQAAKAGFWTGVSMMPMLPYISDRGEHLEAMFEAFQAHGAQYVMPATLTLHGSGQSDSRSLTMRAVAKYYPELIPKYQKHFGAGDGVLPYYRDAFHKKAKELGDKYGLRDRILPRS